jgi:integrase
MPRPSKIWWHASRRIWCVKIDGKQVRLSPNKKEAEKLFHKLMLDKAEQKPILRQGSLLACEVADKFVGWCRSHKADRTAKGYQEHLERFFKWLPNGKTIRAEDLKPYHVVEYMDAHDWGAAYKRNAAAAVQRAFKWAVSVGMIDLHPCVSIPKPKAGRRESPMTEAEYKIILDHTDQVFADVVMFSWESGCRPYEIRTMKPEHVKLAEGMVVFPSKDAKGKKHARAVYLTVTAKAILERRLETAINYVFTNSRGKPWTAFSLNNRLDRLKKWTGRKVALYDGRHGWCQRALLSGLNPIEVAELMGHVDASMVAKTYQHIKDAKDHLRKKLEQVK